MSRVLLTLDKLDFLIVFVDEFTVNNTTHRNYNWAKPGESPGVPLDRYWKSHSCIAAVTRDKLISLSISNSTTNSDTFCAYLERLKLHL